MITLHNLIPAVKGLGVDPAPLEETIGILLSLSRSLDEVAVKGRENVDTLLGCMMAIDAIVGEGD